MNIASVLTRSVSAQPSTPSVGGRYLVPVAATGAQWAGKDGRVAIYTQAGWFFATLPVGKLIFVEDEAAFYYRNTLGVWTAGVGNLAFGNGSVPITSIIGAGASLVVRVENQTTNAPPASPAVGVAYVIGPSPTGSWAGNASKLAMCLSAGVFAIIAPAIGDQVFDKSLNVMISFSASGWAASAGTWIGGIGNFVANPSTLAFTTIVPYTYSVLTAPIVGHAQLFDASTISYTSKRSGSTLRFHFSVDAIYTDSTIPGSTGDFIIALYRDSESSAIDWQRVNATGAGNYHLDHWFEVLSIDSASHVYKVGLTVKYNSSTTWTAPTTLSRRTFRIEESV